MIDAGWSAVQHTGDEPPHGDSTGSDALRGGLHDNASTAGPRDDEGEVADLEDEYDILGELGRGGSAIVFRARDRQLGREVAIKVVRPRFGHADDDGLQRLAREARTVAGLQHPGIVTVHAVKRLRDGGLALVMQLVPGRTLKSVIQHDGALSPEMAERVIRDVAAALAFAHAHGVVHRDVKPENIFIDEASGRALLSDFGIAQSAEFDSRLTMTGTAIGTPSYMSPEQIDGKPTDARSDVYSLGLVAWEMLTGERPWDGETLYNVIYRQKHDDLPPIDAIRPGVPLRLQYIVERCLQKRPAARWAGADGLLGHMNASVLPSDWGQWEASHRRRKARELAASSDAPKGFVGAALATIRFRRRPSESGDDGAAMLAAGDVAARASERAAEREAVREASRVADRAADEQDTTPSWVHEEPAPSRTPRLAVAAAVVAIAAVGAFASIAARNDVAPVRTPNVSVSDAATVQVPIAPPRADSSELASAQFANAQLDSAIRESAKRDSALRDSARAAFALAESAQLHAADGLAARASTAPPAAYNNVAAKPLGRAATDTLLLDDPRSAAGVPALGSRARSGIRGGAIGGTLADAPAMLTRPQVAPSPVGITPATTGAPAATSSAAAADAASAIRSTDDRGIIAAGGRHSCTLDDGHVFCWGANDRGQLGDGNLESRATADGVVGDLAFTQLSAGIAHTCGVTRGGEVYCWGNDERGQLGDATTTSRSAPVRVATNTSYRVVRAGLAHTCGLTTAGVVTCWGANESGQLGDGSMTARSSPVPAEVRTRFISVTAGWNHSCAISAEGTAYCWGDNSAGQLGDGSRTRRLSPVPVLGDVRFTSISAGSTHTCAVSESGEAYCWGRNNFGQLGTGELAEHTSPVKVATTMRFASVTVGGSHSCGRTRSFGVFCWGRNVYGQLGDGTNTDRNTPTRVVGGTQFAALSATGAHTCGVSADGATSCWGYNVEGQLGDGTRNHRARPMRVNLPAR